MSLDLALPPVEAPIARVHLDGATFIEDAETLRRFPALAAFRDTLGDTPLLRVPGPVGGARIYAKCEWCNPAGSVKDRVAFALVHDVLRATPDEALDSLRIYEYSGGNLAVALGRLCRDLQLAVRLVVSSGSPPSLLAKLDAWGAEVDLVDKELGFLGVIEHAHAFAAANPSLTFLYQHRNTANIAFHEQTTGAEIVRQAERPVAAWLASIGTGGTLIGVARALRAANPALRVFGVTPAELPYGSSLMPNSLPKYAGSGGFGRGLRQPFVAAFDEQLDGHFGVSYDDALAGMGEFFDRTGIRIGGSAAANWLSACEVARRLGPDESVVTLFACAGTPEEWQRLGR
ncbi:MAG TPA: pyridoxal-phosphate dependent enzyme [Solirubrobacteraceae bacterium]|jgi:cysteine synthase A|nr:pyridoxal-phosphate dependent enzyme [Solirubrobacteraceae bacterium]